MIYNAEFSVEFNEMVENVKVIAREWRHRCSGAQIESFLKMFCEKLDDMNFKMEFVDDPEVYVKSNLLDAMDLFMDKILPQFGQKTMTYRTFNSIYDCMKEFYFNN